MNTAFLTFDDGLASHAEFVAPLLKQHGFGGTFFVCTEWVGRRRPDGPKTWMHLSGEQIKGLAEQGFEIGNHLHTHCNMRTLSQGSIRNEITRAESILKEHGVAELVSFCPPGFHYDQTTLAEIRAAGYRHVRVGCGKNQPGQLFRTGGAAAPLSLPHDLMEEIVCSVAGCDYSLDQLIEDLSRLTQQQAAVLCFHDFEEEPRADSDWTFAQFQAVVTYLADNEFRVLALRDLESLPTSAVP